MSELTDLEICEQLAEIEGELDILNESIESRNRHLVQVQKKFTLIDAYNPLASDYLCNGLIDKYFLSIARVGNWYVIYKGETLPVGRDDFLSYELSMRKAVALAVIKLKAKK